MSSCAPFASYMKLGQGFNSFTQEVCIEDAVLITPRRISKVFNHAGNLPSVQNTISHERAGEPSGVGIGGQNLARITGVGHISTSTALPMCPPVNTSQPKPGEAVTSSVPEATKAAPSPSQVGASAPDAVEPLSTPLKEQPLENKVAQVVTYSSRSVENMSEVMDALNLSAAASMKYGTVSASSSAAFVNENKVVSSDVNYIVTCKVTNESSPVADDMIFNQIQGVDPADFTEVYGNCFISGFLEGGEFSSIISVRANQKSNIAAVKAAVEAHIAIPALPGLSAGTTDKIDKEKADLLKDCEVTISVNWSGGGDLQIESWDLATVIDVACRFPSLVENCAQRTSAILTRYTSLRSFAEANARLGVDEHGKPISFLLRNYDLCQYYTQDLFSCFLAYKNIWVKLSDIMRHADRYEEKLATEEVPDPIKLSPLGLNEARILARQGMILISRESARLAKEPEIADIDAKGNWRPPPFKWPGELAICLPRKRDFNASVPALLDIIDHRIALTPQEMAAIGHWAQRDDLRFFPLSGDPPPTHSLLSARGRNRIFCTLGSEGDALTTSGMTKLRFHGHERHRGDIFLDFKSHSKHSQGHLSAICFSTAKDVTTQTQPDYTHRSVGRPNKSAKSWSRLADLTVSNVAKVVVEYIPGSGRIAAIVLLDAKDIEITSWKQHSQAEKSRRAEVKIDVQSPPTDKGTWRLCGFWGHSDAIVITRVGAIWKQADLSRTSTSTSKLYW